MDSVKFNDPELRKALKNFCSEMSSSMSRAEAEREYQREAVKLFADEHEVDKRILRKMAKTYHKQNFQTSVTEHEEFEIAYTKVFETEKTL